MNEHLHSAEIAHPVNGEKTLSVTELGDFGYIDETLGMSWWSSCNLFII